MIPTITVHTAYDSEAKVWYVKRSDTFPVTAEGRTIDEFCENVCNVVCDIVEDASRDIQVEIVACFPIQKETLRSFRNS
jgi:hypothetical protein